jgi:hypothetical protein
MVFLTLDYKDRGEESHFALKSALTESPLSPVLVVVTVLVNKKLNDNL